MNKTPIRMLRLPQVIDATGLGKTKISELQGPRRFPDADQDHGTLRRLGRGGSSGLARAAG
jgi:hypothetical protein